MVLGLHLLPSQHSDAPQPTLVAAVAIITHLWSLDPGHKPSAESSAIALVITILFRYLCLMLTVMDESNVTIVTNVVT